MITFDASESEGTATGYAYQWWQPGIEPGAFAAAGLAGYFIYLHPARRTVIVNLNCFPFADEDGMTA